MRGVVTRRTLFPDRRSLKHTLAMPATVTSSQQRSIFARNVRRTATQEHAREADDAHRIA